MPMRSDDSLVDEVAGCASRDLAQAADAWQDTLCAAVGLYDSRVREDAQ